MIKIDVSIVTVYGLETEQRLRNLVCQALDQFVREHANEAVLSPGRTGPVMKSSIDVVISSQLVPGNK